MCVCASVCSVWELGRGVFFKAELLSGRVETFLVLLDAMKNVWPVYMPTSNARMFHLPYILAPNWYCQTLNLWPSQGWQPALCFRIPGIKEKLAHSDDSRSLLKVPTQIHERMVISTLILEIPTHAGVSAFTAWIERLAPWSLPVVVTEKPGWLVSDGLSWHCCLIPSRGVLLSEIFTWCSKFKLSSHLVHY